MYTYCCLTYIDFYFCKFANILVFFNKPGTGFGTIIFLNRTNIAADLKIQVDFEAK